MALYAFDGTWNSPERPTNVWRFREAYRLTPGNEDEPFYVEGVGVGRFGFLGRILGGIGGAGARFRLRRAYHRLCENYARGDREIVVVGFSRGAAMALHFLNVINNYGVNDPQTRRRRGFRHDRWLGWQVRNVYTPTEVHEAPTIRFVGVWDAVQSFGVPLGVLRKRGWGFQLQVPDNVERVYHALALDERRTVFGHSSAAAHESYSFGSDRDGGYDMIDDPTRVKQVWFRGTHADVGGGSEQLGLSDLALEWMTNVAQWSGVRIDPAHLGELHGAPDAPFNRRSDAWLGPPRNVSGGLDLTWGLSADATFHDSVLRRGVPTSEYSRWFALKRFLRPTRWSEPPPDRPLPDGVESMVWANVACSEGMKLAGCDFGGMALRRAKFTGADLRDATFRDADLDGANFERATLTGADFRGASLSGAQFEWANVRGANFAGAQIDHANFFHAGADGANFEAADLTETGMVGASLKSANLTGANLTTTGLPSADVRDAKLDRARLHGTELFGTDLSALDLTALDIVDPLWNDQTCFIDWWQEWFGPTQWPPGFDPPPATHPKP